MGDIKRASADRQVTIDGKVLNLRYSIKAMAALQDHWGLKSFQQVGAKMQALGQELSAGDMVAIIWAGLRTHHPDIDKGAVLDMIDELGLNELQEVMTEAFAGASAGDGQTENMAEGGGGAPARP